ncbi:MAG TPA: hypothetical protein VGJ04_03925 [Pirellulales bacterium]|jgi:hypothetical protein
MSNSEQLDLRRGELVEVRSAEEILATLDKNGSLEDMPFMPEMLVFCGKQFSVRSRADSTCDTVSASGMRRMEGTVHLGLRCDGAAHGGCQAGCLLFWKETWLRRVSGEAQAPSNNGTSRNGAGTIGRDRAWLEARTIQSEPGDSEIRYRCQATELKNASQPLPWWKPGQYLHDIVVNKEPVIDVVRGFVCATVNKLTRRFLSHGFPNVAGTLKQTPVEELNLQPGEWVIVKSREEIVATLDNSGRNRGLMFDGEMLPFCGKRFRVLRRMEQMIEESTGRMLKPRGASVILENVFCTSRFRRVCPRAIYSYWREIWLRRVPVGENLPATGEAPCLNGNIEADHLVPGG